MSACRFLTPRKPIQSRDNTYYQYFTKLWGGGWNVAPGKRHIVVQCNNLFNKAIISYSEVEGNQRNIEHVVKMFRLLTNIDKYFIIVDHCPALDNLSLTIYPV